MKITKEELQKKITEVSQININLSAKDSELRHEFAKAFGWVSTGYSGYNDTSDPQPTWEKIFVKIGKLLSVDRSAEIENKLNSTIRNLEFLRKDFINFANKDVKGKDVI